MSDQMLVREDAPRAASRKPRLALILTLLAMANLGVFMVALTPQLLSLALKMEALAPETATRDLSLMLGTGFAGQVLVLIIVGRLSDFTRSKLGMRRPWLLLGLALIIVASLLMVTATSVAQLWIGFDILSLGVPCCISALYATIPDQIPANRQGMAAGLIGASGVVGMFLGTYLVQAAPGNDMVAFGIPCLIAAAAVLLFCLILPDRRLEEPRPWGWATLAQAFVVDRSKSPLLPKFVASVAITNVSYAVISSYTFYVMGGMYGIDAEQLPSMTFKAQMTVNVIALVFTLAAGPLTDRFGGKSVLYKLAAPLFASGVLIVTFGGSLATAFVGFALVGVAHGLFSGLYLAVGAAVSKDPANSARDINLVAAACTLPSAVVPLFAPMLLGAGGDNFVLLLSVAAAVTLLAILVNAKLRFTTVDGALMPLR